MEIKSLNPDSFYGYDRAANKFATGDDIGELVLQVKPAMDALIKRYELANSSILSIGSGRAHEEFHFLESNCAVDLLDLLDQEIDPFSDGVLQRIQVAQSSKEMPLRYLIGDFFLFLENAVASSQAKYDMIYISGFAPDELDREAIQLSYRRRRTKAEAYASYQSWPEGMPPFLQSIMDLGLLLKENGLFLLQSYRGGVDCVLNPHYGPMVRDQLARNDLYLLETHFFTQSPGVQLIAAVKGQDQYRKWMDRLASKPDLPEFHGRYPDPDLRRDISRWNPELVENPALVNAPGEGVTGTPSPSQVPVSEKSSGVSEGPLNAGFFKTLMQKAMGGQDR
ncbi:hypothetical protein [Hoeflea sp.]|uniref:hypothetical protein n=1 Tax=Hoeflea sp. TaxID=1940281 RepID=UPI003A8E2171